MGIADATKMTRFHAIERVPVKRDNDQCLALTLAASAVFELRFFLSGYLKEIRICDHTTECCTETITQCC